MSLQCASCHWLCLSPLATLPPFSRAGRRGLWSGRKPLLHVLAKGQHRSAKKNQGANHGYRNPSQGTGRKDDTRLKVLIGAAHIADAEVHEETRSAVKQVLERAITAERDREFLKEKGWLLKSSFNNLCFAGTVCSRSAFRHNAPSDNSPLCLLGWLGFRWMNFYAGDEFEFGFRSYWAIVFEPFFNVPLGPSATYAGPPSR